MLHQQGPIGREIIYHHSVSSTNDYLQDLIDQNEKPPEGTLVLAFNQTDGKGLDKNHWESEAGKNLTFSFFLEPRFLQPERQFYLNMSISLGLLDFVRSIIGKDKVTIKWPNDIYIYDKKVAGILIRHAVSGREILHTIAGIGLNVNQQSFSPDLPNPVSIIDYLQKKSDLSECLTTLCKFLNLRYEVLRNGKLSVLAADYVNAMFGLNTWRKFKYTGKSITGKIKGIDDFGHLLLDSREKGELTCDLKEIVFVI